MKLLLVLCALIAAAVATGYGVNTAAQDSNTAGNNLPHPGYNRVYDDFDVPTRGHRRRHYKRRHHHRDSSDSDSDSSSDSSSDSDSRSRSRSHSHDRSDSYSNEYIVLPRPNYGPAQSAPSYGGASQDAPAQTAYGAPAQDNGSGY